MLQTNPNISLRGICSPVLVVIGVAWPLSYVFHRTVDLAMGREIWEFASTHGAITATNTPGRQLDEIQARLRRREVAQLQDITWKDIDEGWNSLYFNGRFDVSVMTPQMRGERARLLAEQAAIDRRTQQMNKSPIVVRALKSRRIPYWALALPVSLPLVPYAFRSRKNSHS